MNLKHNAKVLLALIIVVTITILDFMYGGDGFKCAMGCYLIAEEINVLLFT